MAIAEQFAGLNMKELIGGPLSAAADASALLANSTADFINRVGFDSDGHVRTVAFSYQRTVANDDGTSSLDDMKVDVPMLAIVPIPNLQIDEVNILFDMEVKQSEKSEQSMDMGATMSSSMNLGFLKVNVTGNVSAHSSNTRSSDNSAKYHVDVRATNHGIPEGLARVLDIMAANISPALINSDLKDGNGQDLPQKAKAKAERLKALREEISQIEGQLRAANDGLGNSIAQFKKVGDSQNRVYQSKLHQLLNSLEKDKKTDGQSNDDGKKAALYNQVSDEVNQSWNNFNQQVADMVKMYADSETSSLVFALKAPNNECTALIAYESKESGEYYEAMVKAQSNALTAQKNVNTLEDTLLKKKAEYNEAMSKAE